MIKQRKYDDRRVYGIGSMPVLRLRNRRTVCARVSRINLEGNYFELDRKGIPPFRLYLSEDFMDKVKLGTGADGEPCLFVREAI